jgi:hypothetical protein
MPSASRAARPPRSSRSTRPVALPSPGVRTLGSGRGRRWDDGSIRAALTELLGEREDWPTCDEFEAMGAKYLREVIGRGRGAAWWAREMGLRGGDRPGGGVRRWTEPQIRATLTGFLRGRSTWPSWPEFNAAGLHAFREALRHYGGPERWAVEMGVTLEPPARPFRPAKSRKTTTPASDWPLWSDERIQQELQAFLAGRPDWPRHREFVEGGRKRLYTAILQHGGTERWATRMRVRRVAHPGGSGRLWTDDRIRDALAAFLEGRTHWPASTEFNAAGQQRLLAAIRRHGGTAHWTKVTAIKPRLRERERADSSRTAAAALWDDERIEAAIAPLVRRLGRWPTRGEFDRAGLGPARSAVYRHGGSNVWRERLGVQDGPAKAPAARARHWDERRIETELRRFCRRRRRWPTYSDFLAAGQRRLYNAASRHGGLQYWRTRLGFD